MSNKMAGMALDMLLPPDKRTFVRLSDLGFAHLILAGRLNVGRLFNLGRLAFVCRVRSNKRRREHPYFRPR